MTSSKYILKHTVLQRKISFTNYITTSHTKKNLTCKFENHWLSKTFMPSYLHFALLVNMKNCQNSLYQKLFFREQEMRFIHENFTSLLRKFFFCSSCIIHVFSAPENLKKHKLSTQRWNVTCQRYQHYLHNFQTI